MVYDEIWMNVKWTTNIIRLLFIKVLKKEHKYLSLEDFNEDLNFHYVRDVLAQYNWVYLICDIVIQHLKNGWNVLH